MTALIFFSVFFILFGLVNYYIFLRGYQALGSGKRLRLAYTVVFWLLAVSYIAGTILKEDWPSAASMILVWVGSFWLGALLYFFLFVVLFDFIRLINKFAPIIPKRLQENPFVFKRYLFGGVLLFVVLLLTAGYFNAKNPVVRNLSITLPFEGEEPSDISMLVISDIHMGPKIGIGRLNKMVDLANSQNPDVVLLAGDIIDEDITFLKRKGMGKVLSNLRASYGVFGVMGNHEYISEGEDAYAFLTSNKVTMLRDTAVKVRNSSYLIGREDFQKRNFAGADRQDISQLMRLTSSGFPVVVLDHQPFHPELAARAGAHLMISGHTHHGQLWPLNFITRAVYTLSFGHKIVEGMHLVVSNGIGTWGPPVRIGNRPEMVLISVSFQNDAPIPVMP